MWDLGPFKRWPPSDFYDLLIEALKTPVSGSMRNRDFSPVESLRYDPVTMKSVLEHAYGV